MEDAAEEDRKEKKRGDAAGEARRGAGTGPKVQDGRQMPPAPPGSAPIPSPDPSRQEYLKIKRKILSLLSRYIVL